VGVVPDSWRTDLGCEPPFADWRLRLAVPMVGAELRWTPDPSLDFRGLPPVRLAWGISGEMYGQVLRVGALEESGA